MKLVSKLATICLLGLITSTVAASDTDLLRAAEKGNIDGVRAALQSGAKVDTRSSMGKTALIVAAENGRNGVIEALIAAGADLYAVDNKHWDALTYAGHGKSMSTFTLLLDKGYDLSKNNWQTMVDLRSTRLSIAPMSGTGEMILNSAHPVLNNALAMLEDDYKKRGSGKPGLANAAGSSAKSAVAQTNYQEEVANPILVDISERKLTPEIFKSAATRALLQRGWTIYKSEPEQITGMLQKQNKEYRASITHKPGAMIKIAFVPNYGSPRPNWLNNLREDMEIEMQMAAIRK